MLSAFNLRMVSKTRLARRYRPDLHMPKLALDSPKWMYYRGLDTSLEVFGLVEHRVHLALFLQHAALAWAPSYVPVGSDTLHFLVLGLARFDKNDGLTTLGWLTGLRHVVDVCFCTHQGVNKAQFSIYADIRLYAKLRQVSLSSLVYLVVAPAVLVLSRTGYGNLSSVHHHTDLEHQTFVVHRDIDDGQHFWRQLMLFEPVAKVQDFYSDGNTFDIAQARKFAVQCGLERNFCHGLITQAGPPLVETSVPHHHQLKLQLSDFGMQCVRNNQRQQLRPRCHQVHFIEWNTALRVHRLLRSRPSSRCFTTPLFLTRLVYSTRLCTDL